MLISDNASTFVAASNILLNISRTTKIQDHLLSLKCNWRFIPARAQWFGALYERVIGLVKSGLKKVLGRALVTFDELSSVIIELEAICNDRPLNYVSSDLNELEILTPNHLIYGRKLQSFPNYVIDDDELSDPTYREKSVFSLRFKYISKLIDDMWKRWKFEYLTSIREYQTNKTDKVTLLPKEGDVVLIHDDGPRLKWKMGLITEILEGKDHCIRVVRLKTENGKTTRPVTKLYPLELNAELL